MKSCFYAAALFAGAALILFLAPGTEHQLLLTMVGGGLIGIGCHGLFRHKARK